MIPTPKQLEFIEFSKTQDKPIAWLGSVRGGKTIGGLIAMVQAMKRNPGDYAITSVAQQNVDVNITPNFKRILEAEKIEYKHYRTSPQRFETDLGMVPIYLAGNEGMQKFLQGVTLTGAFSDEILLYPQNFIMQLVARFTHDHGFWTFTANKENPSHWIKTEWIDEGKVVLFESNADDNPHVSEQAKQWWNTLLHGKYKDRMLKNEWSDEYGMIGTPKLLKKARPPERSDDTFVSVWLDEAKGNSCAIVTRSRNGLYYLSNPGKFSTIKKLKTKLDSLNLTIVANLQAGEIPKLSRGCFIKPDIPAIATEYSRVIDRVRLAPDMAEHFPDFRRWSWVAADSTGIRYKPDEATGNVLACAMGVYHATLAATARPFLAKGGTI